MLNFFRRKTQTQERAVAPEQIVVETVDEVPQAEAVADSSMFSESEAQHTATEVVNHGESTPDLSAVFNQALARGLQEGVQEHERLVQLEEEYRELSQNKTAANELGGGWFARLRMGLSKTGNSLRQVFLGVRVDEALFESLEDALLMADVGVRGTETIMQRLRTRIKQDKIEDAAAVRQALHAILVEILLPLEKTMEIDAHKPLVMMVTGVNGAGKTTTIGKLTHHLQALDKHILLAAGDTFRAAAREQLAVWGQRNRVTVIEQASGDPAAVVFDAIASARAKQLDVVIADTAGRLPTQLHLMDELKKVKRVANKALDGAPHEVLLVLDGNMGQNALTQVQAFDEAVGLTGLIITKLDGTAKGGVLVALAVERKIPVYFIGVGEGVNDLQTFDAREFTDALLGE